MKSVNLHPCTVYQDTTKKNTSLKLEHPLKLKEVDPARSLFDTLERNKVIEKLESMNAMDEKDSTAPIQKKIFTRQIIEKQVEQDTLPPAVDTTSWFYANDYSSYANPEHTFQTLIDYLPEVPDSLITETKEKTAPQEEIQLPTFTTEQKDTSQIALEDKFIAKIVESADWILGVVLFSVFLFGIIHLRFGRIVRRNFLSVFNFREARKLIFDQNNIITRVSLGLVLIFTINTGLLIYLIFNYFQIHVFEYPPVIIFLIYAGMVLGIYVLKSFFIYILGFLAKHFEVSREYVFNIFLYNRVLGILLLPLVGVLPFIPETYAKTLIIITLFLIVLLYLFRVFRGIQILFAQRISIFYQILYLCTLEIVPILISYKLATMYL